MSTRQRRLLVRGCGIAAMAAGPLMAQEVARSAMTESRLEHRDEDAELLEVVVTANRRSQLREDVGATVDTLPGASLLLRGIQKTADLSKVVPGFSAADTGVNLPAYSLRGIGLNDPSLAANPTVAVSVDEVPLPYTAMTQGELLDIERVEVVKGPQGTLYGLSATGGAINFIPNSPGDHFSAGADFGIGRFESFTTQLFVSGPLAASIKGRLAVGALLSDAWQKSHTRNDTLGRSERASFRALLNWRPLDRLQLEFNLNGWLDESDSQATRVVAFRAQVPASIPQLPDVFGSSPAPAASRAADWNPLRDYSRDDRFTQVSVKASYALPAATVITSISAWSDYDSEAFNDRDGMVPSAFEFSTDARIESIYQELRLSGDTGSLSWSLGGNYRSDRTHDLNSTDVSRTSNTFIAGMKLNDVDFYNDQDVDTYAAFADGELRVSPRLSLIAGARYTRDDRKFSGSTCDIGDGETSAVYTFLANNFRAARGLSALTPIPAGACVTLDADTLQPGVVRDELQEDNVSFRAQANLRVGQHSLLYAGFSRGFKAGSFSTVSAVFSPVYGPATQERVDAIEAGFNAGGRDRRLRAHGAAFHYDYRDKQFRGRVLDPVIGSLQKLVNIPRSTIQGVELDLTASPLRGLTMGAAVTYLHTEVTEFTGVNLFGVPQDFAGQTLPYTPPWSANLGSQYEWVLRDGVVATAGADLVYRSRTSGFIGRDRPVDVESYATLDVRGGVSWQGGRWHLSFWAHNVTGTNYVTSAMRVGDTLNNYAARPETYGLQLGFRH